MFLNSTGVVLPPGTSNHGNPNLVCFPAKWSDIATFFLGNYVAHAATILSLPGQPTYESFMNIVFALLFPVNAVRRGFNAIFSLAKFGATELRMAARAGALCKVIRTTEFARTRREFSLSEGPSFLRIKIHGRASLPEGYGLAIVPSNAVFQNDNQESDNPITISSDWSMVKILVAIAQLLFAIATLYRTKGDQIDQFGYAAFGLTVIQYALMSLLNILGNFMCPQYPTMYLVQSETMLAAQNDGGVFVGIVGTLDEDVNDALRDTKQPDSFLENTVRGLWWLPLCWLPLAVTLITIWALSQFQQGTSSLEERILTMAWLAVGSWVGAGGYAQTSRAQYNTTGIYTNILVGISISLVFAAPVIAGFWVVAREILRYVYWNIGTKNIAKVTLGGIENSLKQGVQMGKAMKEASGKGINEAVNFAHDHPYFCALIAVGVLAILMPWVLETLGFAELGLVEGSIAAWWQLTYRGYVTQKSLFSFFQRLGMV